MTPSQFADPEKLAESKAQEIFPDGGFSYRSWQAEDRRSDYVFGFLAGFSAGRDAGVEECLEKLRSKEAENKCVAGTSGTCEFVSHEEWADWLESQMKEKK